MYPTLLYGISKFSILIGWQAVRKNPYPDRGPYFPYLDRCPGKFLLCKQKKFLLPNFPIVCRKNLQIKMSNNQVNYILLPSETDDSRFNSREKHMLTDSVQPL
jgi:hypothetical protein